MRTAELNAEAIAASESVAKVTRQDIVSLKARAKKNPRGKCRLLLHRSVDDALHEMLIVHAKGHYIRPHKNIQSSKSYHVVEGALVCILFDDDGNVTDHFLMGEYFGTDIFLARLSTSCYHTLVPLTDQVVFIETILGPFKGTTYAPWAPEEESDGGLKFYENLSQAIGARG